MGQVTRHLFRIVLGIALLFALGCGMGGTEVGNPRPGLPATAEDGEATPTFDEVTPSPSPDVEDLEFDAEENLE